LSSFPQETGRIGRDVPGCVLSDACSSIAIQL
jgi:hypothetical protein